MKRVGGVGGAIAMAALLGACTVLSSPSPSSPPTALPAPGTDLWHDGPWITDASGRVVVLHGVNMVDKNPPYFPAAEGFDEADISLIQSMGLNLVRLGVLFSGLMPEPGQINQSYLAALESQVSQLAAADIYVLLDFHQDEYSGEFTGDGFPAWMVQTNGAPDIQFGFPENYLFNPAVNAAFDSFWENSPVNGGPGTPWGTGIQNYYQEGLAAVASVFASNGDVVGYEIMNEPWPGSVYPTCLNATTGCPAFDNGPYLEFIQRSLTAIRSVDRDHLVFYEPNVLFNEGFPTGLGYVGDPGTGFAFHVYPFCGNDNGGEFPGQDQICGPEEEQDFANAKAQDARSGAALLMTEFGASTNDDGIDRVMNEADAAMVGWAFWSFDGIVVPDIAEPPTGSNLDEDVVADLARPYPQTVAGVPTSWSYDTSSGVFSLTYSTAPISGGTFAAGTTTDISVPALTYPDGYDVVAAGATVVSAPNAPVLQLATAGKAQTVNVTVSPAG